MHKPVRLLVLLLGMGVAVYLIYQHGGYIRDALARVGWGFLPYMAASFLLYALDTWGWRLAFMLGQPHVGFGRLFGIRMAGEAVNKVTPLASMGGEPLKAYLLAREGASMNDTAASVAVAKNVMTIAQIVFIFSGIAIAAPLLPGKGALLLGLGLFPGIILLAIVITALLDLRLRRMRRSGKPAAPAGRLKAVAELWAQAADFYWNNPRAGLLSFILFYLGWAAGALELLAGAHALGFQLSLQQALAMEAMLASINMATFFIPANAGSQEGGFALLAPLFNVSTPHGVALAVLRRCRDVIWVLFGLAYLGVAEGRVLFHPHVDMAKEAAS